MRYLSLALVSLSLSGMAMNLATMVALENPDNAVTFHAFSEGGSHYLQLRQEWRPRVLSNLLASWTAAAAEPHAGADPKEVDRTIGLWTFAWFLAVSAMLVRFFPDRAFYYLFGCFAAFAFDYLPRYNDRAYPWDLPSLAVFTLFIGLYARSRTNVLMAAIPVGMLFKETAIVLPVAFLFLPGLMAQRVKRFALCIVACIGVKMAANWLVRGPVLVSMTANVGPSATPHLFYNVLALLSIHRPGFDHPVLVNAGTFAAFLCVPRRLHTIRMLKSVAIAFAAGIFVFGRVEEYRVWLEMIPVSLYGLDLAMGSRSDDGAGFETASG